MGKRGRPKVDSVLKRRGRKISLTDLETRHLEAVAGALGTTLSETVAVAAMLAHHCLFVEHHGGPPMPDVTDNPEWWRAMVYQANASRILAHQREIAARNEKALAAMLEAERTG